MVYKHGKHEIELFDSIHGIDILRFQRFNKLQMMASEIGNTFEDADKRFAKMIQFGKKKMLDEMLAEAENLRMTIFNAYNESTPTGRSFAIMVKRIDGIDYTNDFSSDALDKVLEHLNRIGFSYEMTVEKLSEVKKKSKRNWRSIIQSIFQRTETRNKPS